MLNPEHYSKNVKEKCRLAEVDRSVYYDAIKKPEFVRFYNNMVVEILKTKVVDVINATYKFATKYPNCHQDRKILLQMTGMHTDKQDIDLSIKEMPEIIIKRS